VTRELGRGIRQQVFSIMGFPIAQEKIVAIGLLRDPFALPMLISQFSIR